MCASHLWQPTVSHRRVDRQIVPPFPQSNTAVLLHTKVFLSICHVVLHSLLNGAHP